MTWVVTCMRWRVHVPDDVIQRFSTLTSFLLKCFVEGWAKREEGEGVVCVCVCGTMIRKSIHGGANLSERPQPSCGFSLVVGLNQSTPYPFLKLSRSIGPSGLEIFSPFLLSFSSFNFDMNWWILDGGPQWEPDNSSEYCRGCGKTFSLVRRRHHCRSCGRLLCMKCVTQEKIQSSESSSSASFNANVKVCLQCADVWKGTAAIPLISSDPVLDRSGSSSSIQSFSNSDSSESSELSDSMVFERFVIAGEGWGLYNF